MLDERSADVRVITDAVAMDDGITSGSVHRKRISNAWVATRTIHRGPSV